MKYCECGCGELAPISKYSNAKTGYVKGEPRRFVYGHSTKLARKFRSNPDASVAPDDVVCGCGCGEVFTAKVYWKAGVYLRKRFVIGHEARMPKRRETSRELIKSAGLLARETNRGENHHWYKNGACLYKARNRWIVITRSGCNEFWSRVVMRNKIMRPLLPREVVHHINAIKDDDRPENLMLFKNNNDHTKWHWDNDMMKNKKLVPSICLCGCGASAAPGKIYISGHNSRVDNPMKKKSQT